MGIKCNAYDCKHNNNIGECFANKVVIKGKLAKTTHDTICASFEYYSPSLSNASVEFANEFLSENNLNTMNAIKCNATNCKFNNNTKCSAKSIQINKVDTSCETFIE